MKKLLPPHLFVLSVIGIVLSGFLELSHYPIPYPFNLLGLVLLFLGLGIANWHKALFARRKTNIFTFEQPDRLVKEGLFRYSRNPMYLGFVLALGGVVLLVRGGWVSWLIWGFFGLVVDRWYILYEEKVMQNKFGEEYLAYREEVRRWL